MFLLLKGNGRQVRGGKRLTGLVLLLPLALRSRPGGGLGFLHVGLARRLVVGGVAVHVGLLHAGVVASLDLGDEVGVHGCLLGVLGWWGWVCWVCWVLKRWIEDGARMEGLGSSLGGCWCEKELER